MVKSNVISISVTQAIQNVVESNTLSVDKTTGYVGDTFHFTGRVTGSINPDYYYVRIDVYINDTVVNTLDVFPKSTSFDEPYSFDFTPDAAGTYSVYTDAYIVPLRGGL